MTSSRAALAAILLASAPLALAHWPGQPEHQFVELGDLQLEAGGVIKNFRMSYVTHGKLNAAKDNAILVIHGFSGNHHAMDHLIGPGKALDTNKYFIICPDELGNPQTTFEHTTSPTNSGLKMSFPLYNGRDRVKTEHLLVTKGLGISHLFAMTGISTGGDDSVQMAVSYPDFVDAILPLSGGGLYSTQAVFYLVPQQLSVLETCAGWRGGDYEENPKACASNAIALMIPFLFTRDWWEQYIDAPEVYTKWRNTQGQYYFDIQDARDLYYRLHADLRGWVGDTPGFNGDLNAILGSIKAKTLFLANPQDQFIPTSYFEAMVKAIPRAEVVWIDSVGGHMMAMNADPNATRVLGEAMGAFLEQVRAQSRIAESPAPTSR
jgi:homoserine O-acetyltransferase